MSARSNEAVAAITAALRDALAASHVEVVDESHRHAGHAGASSGGGHYRVLVVSERFEGLSRIAAQRLVYAALGELMRGQIHALQMTTLTPEAWADARARAAAPASGRDGVS